ncbi:TPA: thioredoxin-disulfide reductase [Patescibacteria group bacterium]|jgi:alkyl hydroperoxide reductase subunit F|nr:thioredoxin-disulfide reductase [Patescibacteria group bacterium]
MYDVIIIGAGPAGMTAAIYTARKRLNTLVLGKEAGGQMVWSSDVENYTGFSVITGAELTLKFQEHLATLKDSLEVKIGSEVVSLEKNITSFVVEDTAGNQYFSKAVIIASGRSPKHLGIPGESEFFGHGVATCATCDAPLYKKKTVAVVGGGNSALDAALALSKVATLVYIIDINQSLVGDVVLKQKIENSPNVKILNNTKSTAILGDKVVTGLEIEPFGKPREVLKVDGVFIEIGYEPNHKFDELTEKNAKGEIKVDADLMTNVPGLFAAGDINDAWGEQIIIAAGEGAKAAMAVSDYLNKLK